MKYEQFTPRQKAAYWDTFIEQEQINDTRTRGEWMIEYRRYRMGNEDAYRYVMFLAGNYILSLLASDYKALYEIMRDFH